MTREAGVMGPQAKECPGPPEAGRGRQDPLLESSEGHGLANSLILDFSPLALWEIKFVV